MRLADVSNNNNIRRGDVLFIELGPTLLETTVSFVSDNRLVVELDSTACAMIETAEKVLAEAEYRGRKVPLGKPMRGDVKKFKVYVKKPNGSIVKVNFGHGGTSAKKLGQKTMRIKKSNPARRKSFRARHNCSNPGPRWKARFWSCRAW
jgi:hypothetical protein